MDALEKLKALSKELELINAAVATMAWDQRTYMPPKSAGTRSEAIGYLSTIAFKKFISDETGEIIRELEKEDNFNRLDENEKAMVRIAKREYEKAKAIPPELFQKFTITASKSETVWEQAKKNNDFKSFQPYLEELLEMLREMAELYGYKENPYDALLDKYEPGITTRKLKKIIETLKAELIPFLREIIEQKGKTDPSILYGRFGKKAQEKLSIRALKAIGYDFEAGRLDETVHPFTISLGAGDVRVTTKYDPHFLQPSLYGTFHEGGHALYEQGLPEEFKYTPIYGAVSLGIHESQSRMMENMVARSYEFLKFFYPEIKKVFPKQFGRVSLDRFYRAINHVEPSLIRIEADEVTYNFHIMLRFELEEAMLNKSLEVKDLPRAWNEKIKEYLGIEPQNDAEGVLQDVHWANGMIGYFPSYMLGNLYAAQLFAKAEEEIPKLRKNIEKGNVAVLIEWLRENIHRHGKKYLPEELIKISTGEELNPEYFIRYIKEKYTKIYEI
ncbi:MULTISPECIES: carboxypeptidase M32 [Kosmotoga]|uniref:Metal-dependent carboxypeptidase n=1 Tax=Kosmotoga olearia (strain ATCC BAA-1733 / DSM 21960 / TBF 19.5.1) TaxID=521045 RepID=C5CGD4_KOSOT|nr:MULTISPECIES: carboxypeptidase M32 [Kosmotoga]ACR80515.1 Carboxypeptidase Taq [Kosmotoga olearia TBF 19.5.1]MDI3523354.1 carboxypeptidase Taq [Kosmotoga sp.]MDK2953576.1 carboxypeptidase Taq [Kosmotoga sp.]